MNYKLRLKDPSGAEFEAEGPADFVQNEKKSFLEALRKAGQAAAPGGPWLTGEERPAQESETGRNAPGAFWNKLIARGPAGLSLKLKSPGVGAAEAALVLLSANRVITGEATQALELSKALKTSGYQPDRLDRLLSRHLKSGKISASGSKRNRTYRITQKGLEQTYQTISKLLKEEQD